jgi:hypothetical protein
MANITVNQQKIVEKIRVLKSVNKQIKRASMIKKAELAVLSMDITADIFTLMAFEIIPNKEV